MSTTYESYDLFRIDAESLEKYSQEISGVVDRNGNDDRKDNRFDFKVDVPAYIHMFTNLDSEVKARNAADLSIREAARKIIMIAEVTKEKDAQIAGVIEEKDEL